MDLTSIVTGVLIAAAAVFLVLYILYCLARWAWTRARGAYVLGAALSPFGAAGNVSDPDFRIVNEAKHGGNHEEGDAGDPPNDE